MISTMFRAAGRLALWLATMAFLTATALFVIGSFLLTYPLMRLSPRDRRIKAGVDFASSGMSLLTAFGDSSVKALMDQQLADASADEPAEPDARV